MGKRPHLYPQTVDLEEERDRHLYYMGGQSNNALSTLW